VTKRHNTTRHETRRDERSEDQNIKMCDCPNEAASTQQQEQQEVLREEPEGGKEQGETQEQGEGEEGEEKKEFEEVMDSMCMQCGGTGVTRYMIHKIPYFRELVISSFDCNDEECGEHNNEVTFGGEIQMQGCAFTLEVLEQKDLDRQLIKSDSASVLLPR
jgi:zinc finger protein